MIKQNEELFKKMGLEASKINDYISLFYKPLMGLTTQNLDSTAFVTSMTAIVANYTSQAKDIPIGFSMTLQKNNFPVFEKQINGVWYRSMLSTNYSSYWAKTKLPILALFGEKDIQVDAQLNVKALQNLNKSNIQIKVLPSHNHLFQIAKTGNVDEYAKLKTSISEECLNNITSYIKTIYK
jgi:pimeloyl-ACP methyl ester carboxylesterase